MSVAIQKTRLVQLSVLYHLRSILTTAGWDSTSSWVVEGRVTDTHTTEPIVAILVGETRSSSYEMGNTEKMTRFFVNIEVYGGQENRMNDLRDCITDSLHNIAIIDFNSGMPGDLGYDAEAQRLTYGGPMGDVTADIKDSVEYTARVSFILQTKKPI